MHESRYMWAIHVVHHSSERYNLSTALRQPVAEGLTMRALRPAGPGRGAARASSRTPAALNLIYQYWIHTETIRSIGPLENVLNTPSHHRVHHGINRQYLDRNHGSILIIWDRLFGTFEREDERGRLRPHHEHRHVQPGDHRHPRVARHRSATSPASTTWRERLSYVLRGPGWAYDRRAEVLGAAVAKDAVAA